MKLKALLVVAIALLVGILFWPRIYRELRPQWVGDPLASAPRTILWAWDRPEDMRFLDQRRYGIATLAATITLDHDQTVLAVRKQPLMLPKERTFLVATVRIEAKSPSLSPEQLTQTAAHLRRIASEPYFRVLQIDFEAGPSERAFYRSLLVELRPKLRADQGLSITAPVSWCTTDPWIADLPIDEAVPMLFRSGGGQDRNAIAGLGPKICQYSFGLSTAQVARELPEGRRFYLFHPAAWTQVALTKLQP